MYIALVLFLFLKENCKKQQCLSSASLFTTYVIVQFPTISKFFTSIKSYQHTILNYACARAPVLGTAVVFNCKRQEKAFSKAVNVWMPLFWSFLLTFTAYLWSEAGTDLKTWTLRNKTAINVRHCWYKSALSARNWSAFVVFSVVKARQRKHHPLCQKITTLSIQTATVCIYTYIPIRDASLFSSGQVAAIKRLRQVFIVSPLIFSRKKSMCRYGDNEMF